MNENRISENVVLELSIKFSIMTIAYCEDLNLYKNFILSKQLLRAACSIGANIMEAQNAESKPDFIHKMKIAAKEADETQYWLILCKHARSSPDTSALNKILMRIQKLLTAIISTTKKKAY